MRSLALALMAILLTGVLTETYAQVSPTVEGDSERLARWAAYTGPTDEALAAKTASTVIETQSVIVSCGSCKYRVNISLAITCGGNAVINTTMGPINDPAHDCPWGWAFIDVTTPPAAWFTPNGSPAGLVNGLVSHGDLFSVKVIGIKLTDGTICEVESDAITFTGIPDGVHIHTGSSCSAAGDPIAAYLPALTAAPASYPVHLRGNVRIDQPMITERDWYVHTGHRIYVPTGGAAKFIGSEISSVDCSDLWHGFIVEGSGQISVQEQTTIRDAVYGIYVSPGSSGQVDIADTRFLENYVGVFTLNNTSLFTGVFNSEFSSPSYKPYLSECLPAPNWGKCTRGYAGFVANRARYITFAEDPGSNRFYELSNGIVAIDTKLIVFDASFDDIAEPCYAWQGGTAVLFNETPTPNTIGGIGWCTVRRSRFDFCDVGVQMTDTRGGSNLIVSENQFSRIWESVIWNARDNAVGSTSWGMKNQVTAMQAGRYLPARAQSPNAFVLLTDQDETIGGYVFQNYIQSQMDNARGVYLLNTGTGVKPASTLVDDNFVDMLVGNNQIGIDLQGDNMARVTGNIGGQAQPQSGYGLRSVGGSNNWFCYNQFDMLQQPGTYGLHVSCSPYVSITENIMSGGFYNISVAGTCLPGSIAKNTTSVAGSVAILHTPPASMPGGNVVGNQFWKQNTWLTPGVIEVKTFGGDQYYVNSNLPNSSFGDYFVQPGSSSNLSCGATTGDPLTGGGTGGQDAFSVTSASENFATAAIGDLQLQQVAAYRALSKSSMLTSDEQVFLADASDAFPGFYLELERLSSLPTLTPAEQTELREALGIDGDRLADSLGARDEAAAERLVTLANSRKGDKLASIQTHLSGYTPANVAEARVLAVLAPLYKDVAPSDADRALWRTTAESCHEDFGLAVDLAAAAYTSYSPNHERIEACSRQELRLNVQSQGPEILVANTLVSTELVLLGDLTERQVSVYGADGRQVRTWAMGDAARSNFHVDDLAPGMYFLQVEGQTLGLKFVKQ